jgi:hypothetical protein
MGTSFGWEGSYNNNGASVFYQIPTSCPGGGFTLTGVQLSIAAAPGSVIGTGFAELLAQGFLTGPGAAPTFNPPTYQLASTSVATILKEAGVAGVITNNGGNVQNCLFQAIMKQWMNMSYAALGLEYNEYIYLNNVWAPAGGYIVLHMDHAGVGPLDCEIQGKFDGFCDGNPI